VQTFLSISRFHIVTIAALGTFTFGWLFLGEYPWLLSFICALDWFIVNLLNRVVDLQEDQANQIFGTPFVSRHKPLLLWTGFSLLLLSLIAVYFLLPEITIFRLVYHALGLSYNWPLLPGKRRIKELYFWKNTASAIGFLLTLFCYPLALAYGKGNGWIFPPGITLCTVLLTAGFFFLFEISYEVIYDLRDQAGDRQAGIKTYPVVHGERGAIYIIDSLIVASFLILLIGYLAGGLPWRIFIMGAAPIVQIFLYKHWLRRGITTADCIHITWLGAGFLFVYHIWYITGLPGAGLK
jgi:4-hydroxybenzoate polyprenyltransferase